MNYKEAIIYLEKRKKINFGLQRIKKVLHFFNFPEKELKIIHITGTKGKGSVSNFTNSILQNSNYKIGLFTSPYFLNIRASIKINEKPISCNKFTFYVEKIKEASSSIKTELTFFEILTVIAILFFQEKKIDIAIFEVGMGGRRDATNCLNSIISVITNVDYEHQKFLGKSLSEIALEKSGIIKKENIVITGINQKKPLDIIKKVCCEKNAKLINFHKNYKWQIKNFNQKFQKFNLIREKYEYKNLQIFLLGESQIINASFAIAIIENLKKIGYKISITSIRKGLKNTYLPGRLEIISKKPLIIFDGAHTSLSIKNLKQSLEKYFNYKNLILVFGIQKDKLYTKILKEIFPLAKKIILTKSTHENALFPEILYKEIHLLSVKCKESFHQNKLIINKKNVVIFTNPQKAFSYGCSIIGKNDCLCIAGSLYLIADCMKYFLKKYGENKNWQNF
ncbi:MAG: folylpolyglutamate synthase/dihydrofolate synthase family protein [bacterium]